MNDSLLNAACRDEPHEASHAGVGVRGTGRNTVVYLIIIRPSNSAPVCQVYRIILSESRS